MAKKKRKRKNQVKKCVGSSYEVFNRHPNRKMETITTPTVYIGLSINNRRRNGGGGLASHVRISLENGVGDRNRVSDSESRFATIFWEIEIAVQFLRFSSMSRDRDNRRYVAIRSIIIAAHR